MIEGHNIPILVRCRYTETFSLKGRLIMEPVEEARYEIILRERKSRRVVHKQYVDARPIYHGHNLHEQTTGRKLVAEMMAAMVKMEGGR